MSDDLPSRPPLRSTRVALRPVVPGDTPRLFEMAFSPNNCHRWRYFGGSTSFAEFDRLLWDRVLCQFVVTRASNPVPIGLVQCVASNFRHGTAQINVLLAEGVQRQAWPFEGVVLFVNYLFETFPLRKLYAEVPEFNFAAFAGGAGRYFATEGRLTAHEWHLGRYWDLLILAMTRETVLTKEIKQWLAGLETPAAEATPT